MGVPTVLVPYDGSAASDRMLRMACDAAAARGGRVVALALTQVHRALPLANLPPVFDEPGWRALFHAEEVAKQRGTSIEPRLRHTYDAGRTIVREAHALQADAIFLALKPPRFSWLPLRLGGTARTVMRGAPCPVILGHVHPAAELDATDALAEAERVLNHAP